MLEKWGKALENGDCFGALLTDHWNGFECFLRDLLTGKLHGYGFNMNSLKCIYSCLNDRKKRVKTNNSSFKEIIFGVSQGSILGPKIFNAFISDLFFYFK